MNKKQKTKNKKIAVIGGSGKSGRYLVKHLVAQGFQIKLLLRNPNQFTFTDHLRELVEGNILQYVKVLVLLQGCEAVISCLGLGVAASEPTLFAAATKNVLQSMEELQISRYIVTSGLNVDTAGDKKA